MPYVLNTDNGKIHDASKEHIVKAMSKGKDHYELFETIQEAKAIARRNGNEPTPCMRCRFSQAVRDEISG